MPCYFTRNLALFLNLVFFVRRGSVCWILCHCNSRFVFVIMWCVEENYDMQQSISLAVWRSVNNIATASSIKFGRKEFIIFWIWNNVNVHCGTKTFRLFYMGYKDIQFLFFMNVCLKYVLILIFKFPPLISISISATLIYILFLKYFLQCLSHLM